MYRNQTTGRLAARTIAYQQSTLTVQVYSRVKQWRYTHVARVDRRKDEQSVHGATEAGAIASNLYCSIDLYRNELNGLAIAAAVSYTHLTLPTNREV